MKLSSIWSAAAIATCAVAEDAYLWTVDHGSPKYANTQASSISSRTASSILARRRGFSNDQYSSSADGRALKDVNQYGGYQMPMYDAGSDPVPAKLFIRITGFTGAVSQFPSLPDLWIEDAASDLADGFKARKDVEGVCEYSIPIPTKDGVELVYSYYPEDGSCKSAQQIQMQPDILVAFSSVPVAKDAPQNINKLLRTLSHLSATANLESTILILPPKSKLRKAKNVRRADPEEEPLEFLPEVPEPASKSFPAAQAANTSRPLPSIIPQCYASQDACEDTTNSCSGHGKCYKAHNGCYACKCTRTVVRTNSDGGNKTVQWGGNACQKKDVSMEFTLFASFGIVMAALVAGALGALYSMGSQELPSVIGAGVGGPKAQK